MVDKFEEYKANITEVNRNRGIKRKRRYVAQKKHKVKVVINRENYIILYEELIEEFCKLLIIWEIKPAEKFFESISDEKELTGILQQALEPQLREAKHKLHKQRIKAQERTELNASRVAGEKFIDQLKATQLIRLPIGQQISSAKNRNEKATIEINK